MIGISLNVPQKLASLRNSVSMRANAQVHAERFLIKDQNCGWEESAPSAEAAPLQHPPSVVQICPAAS